MLFIMCLGRGMHSLSALVLYVLGGFFWFYLMSQEDQKDNYNDNSPQSNCENIFKTSWNKPLFPGHICPIFSVVTALRHTLFIQLICPVVQLILSTFFNT